MTASAQIDMTGPFFQVDPGETMLQNLQKMMQGIAEEGAAAVRSNLSAGAGTRALVAMTQDRVADHVIGRTTSLTGKQWVSAAVVQVSNNGLDGATSRSLMAAASYLEGKGHGVRKVASQVRRSRSVLSANLSAGLE